MLNKFPWWKNLLVFVVIALGFFYALPNLYGEDPALQISGTHGATVDASVQERVQNLLTSKNITGDYELENEQLLIRFTTTEQQILARDLVQDALGDNFITALNLAPATPAWMRSLGMHPLKLGLDLRGGVHFLMEVDMDEAMKKMREQLVSDLRNELRENNLRLAGARAEGDDVLITFRDAETHAAAFIFHRLRLLGFFRLRIGFLARALAHVDAANGTIGVDASGNAFFSTATNGGFGLPVLHKGG